jgi:hypothetical protein
MADNSEKQSNSMNQEVEKQNIFKRIIAFNDNNTNNTLSRHASMLHPYREKTDTNKPKDPKINKLKKLFGF